MKVMKKQAQKATSSVTVQTGPLAGMTFTVEDSTLVENDRMRVKYVAPNNGPRAVVEHVQIRGEFQEADKESVVRIAFSKLLPASIQWQADRGYSDRTAGTPLTWDRSLSRFVTAEKDSANEAKRNTKETEGEELSRPEKES